MGPVRALFPTRCSQCRERIAKNADVVFVDDHPCHPECEPDYGPWETWPTCPSVPLIRFAALVRDHKTIARACMDADLDTKRLPEAVAEKLLESARVDAELACLVDDILLEHSDG